MDGDGHALGCGGSEEEAAEEEDKRGSNRSSAM